MHHFKPCNPCNVAPTVVHPTKQCVANNFCEEEVNHIHPTHTTLVNNKLIKNKHYYPQTGSVVNQVAQTNVNMGPGLPPQMGPMAGPAPMGPGPMGPMGMNMNAPGPY